MSGHLLWHSVKAVRLFEERGGRTNGNSAGDTDSHRASGAIIRRATNRGHSGAVAAVGDPAKKTKFGDSAGAVYVFRHGSPGHGSDSGAVYVFVRSGASWSEQAILRAEPTAPNDRLGYSVALSSQLVVAGAAGRQNSPEKSGYACVFVRTGTTWSPPAQLLPPSPQIPSRFGTSVAIIDAGRVLVGDPIARKAYVFAFANGICKQTDVLDGILVKSFGSSLSTSDATAVVGAPTAAAPVAESGAALVFSLA
jgi:FG-GAP repeat